MSATETAMPRADLKIPELVEEAASNLGDIVRNEVRLAKAEADKGAADAMRGIVLLAVALLVLIPALVLIALGCSGWLSLEAGLDPWLAHLLTGAALVAVGLVAFAVGGRSLASRHVRLRRSIRSVGKDIQTVREAT